MIFVDKMKDVRLHSLLAIYLLTTTRVGNRGSTIDDRFCWVFAGAEEGVWLG